MKSTPSLATIGAGICCPCWNASRGWPAGSLQRIGLSATVGNPELLIDWLAGPCAGERVVYRPTEASSSQAEVKLDYVGSLENAAVVISRLHRGEKRLVFVDSRARAEELGAELRQLNVTAFVTHSSLSQEQRRQAEDAFANRDDCVIVATSVLELGIDVGNLDRVIQIDSPTTVSSFLQRMGRTGRRAGTLRNCLFLATRDESLVQAAGLIDLWAEGLRRTDHTAAGAVPRLGAAVDGSCAPGARDRPAHLAGMGPPGAGVQPRCPRNASRKSSPGCSSRASSGRKRASWGSDARARRNTDAGTFCELLSVFLSPPLFAVLHGRQEVGFVDELTFVGKQEGSRVLLLGGRAWRVTHIDWQRKVAHVEMSEAPGRSRWKGAGQGLSYRLCQAIKRVLATDDSRPCWSQRARTQIETIRGEFPWLTVDASAVVTGPDGDTKWWTFAGQKANAALAPALANMTQIPTTSDSLSIDFDRPLPPEAATASDRRVAVPRPRDAAARSDAGGPGGPEVLRVPAASPRPSIAWRLAGGIKLLCRSSWEWRSGSFRFRGSIQTER